MIIKYKFLVHVFSYEILRICGLFEGAHFYVKNGVGLNNYFGVKIFWCKTNCRKNVISVEGGQ